MSGYRNYALPYAPIERILELRALGLTNAAIAERLSVTRSLIDRRIAEHKRQKAENPV